MTPAELIYFALGVTTEEVPQEVVDYYISAWTAVYPDNECLVLHNTMISIYNYLVRTALAEQAGGGLGTVEKEKEGKVEVEYRDDVDPYTYWQQALNNYLKSPWEVFPQCRVDLSKNLVGGRVIVGGVREDKIRDIDCNDNIRTGGASEIDGVKQQTPRRYGYIGFYRKK